MNQSHSNDNDIIDVDYEIPEGLNVTEIFYSIQGEGPLTGRPAVFVRLAGCNLSCHWCDSKYTWKKGLIEKHFMTFEEIKKEIYQYMSYEHETLLIFTGGEPLLQQGDIVDFLNYLYGTEEIIPKFQICFETNGTITPSPVLLSYRPILVVSLKLHKYEWAYQNIWWDKSIPGLYWKYIYFKFVIETRASSGDYTELQLVDHFLDRFPKTPREQIYIMPEGISPVEIYAKLPSLFEYAKRQHVNVSTRLQILAYGNKRGT